MPVGPAGGQDVELVADVIERRWGDCGESVIEGLGIETLGKGLANGLEEFGRTAREV